MPESKRSTRLRRVEAGLAVVTFLLAMVPNLSGTRSAAGIAILLAVSAGITWRLYATSNFVTKQHRTKRLTARLLSGLVIAGTAYGLWLFFRPVSREQVKVELLALVKAKAWGRLAEKLPSVEAEPAFHDVGLYYRGVLYSSASPGPDPERFLAQIPPGSDLFKDAQWLRLSVWTKAPTEERARAIADSLERASLQNPVYYRLRLAKREMSYAEIATLYAEFSELHKKLFNFAEMKNQMTGQVGVYFHADLNEVTVIPACAILFLYREIDAARRECLADQSRQAGDKFGMLSKNNGREDFFLKRLGINPALQDELSRLREEPLPAACGGGKDVAKELHSPASARLDF